MPEVKQEKYGFRDLGLSDRHRKWGWDCPAIDLDYVEYDEGIPVAILEFKHENAKREGLSLKDSKLRALSTLGECAGKPFFVVRYKSDYSMYHVIPMNTYAKKIMPKERFMPEEKWVRWLHEELRGRECPQSVIDGLKVIA